MKGAWLIGVLMAAAAIFVYRTDHDDAPRKIRAKVAAVKLRQAWANNHTTA